MSENECGGFRVCLREGRRTESGQGVAEMIIYDLRCVNEHRFEGWFRSATDFEAQMSRHLVSCPQCDSEQVRRVPSAVAIGGHAPSETRGSRKMATMPAGTQMIAAYRELVRTLIANSDDVGDRFAEEARKIHYDDAPDRTIHGTATQDDLTSLADEGISESGDTNLSFRCFV
jgi:hypothetical protein